MFVGKLSKGGTVWEAQLDTKRVARYVVGEDVRVPKLSAYLDGLGSGGGDALVKGVVYDLSGNFVAMTGEETIPDGMSPAWVDLPFALPGGIQLPAAVYDIGLIFGGTDRSARVFGDDPGIAAYLATMQMTFQGGEVTDAKRLALQPSHDGAAGEPVWNLAPYGGFETGDTTGWTYYPAATTTITVETQVPFVRNSAHSLKIVTPGLQANEGVSASAAGRFAAGPGDSFTMSIDVYSPAGGERMTWGLDSFRSDNTYIASSVAQTVTLVPGWQRLSSQVTISTDPSVALAGVYLRTSSSGSPQAITVWIDNFMVEPGFVTAGHSYVETVGQAAYSVQGTPTGRTGFYKSTRNLVYNSDLSVDTTYWVAGNYQPANLIANAQFNSDTSGWQAYSGGGGTLPTLALDTATYRTGPSSAKIITNGTGTQQGLRQSSSIAVTAGTTYTYSVWMKGTAGVSFQLWVDERDASLTTTRADQTTFTATGSWQLVSVTFTAQATTTNVMLYLFANGAPPPATTFWADSFVLEVGATATGFSDGAISRVPGGKVTPYSLRYRISNRTGWGAYFGNNLYTYWAGWPGGGSFDMTKRYTLSFWARLVSGNPGSLGVYIHDGSSTKAVLNTGNGYTLPADGSWTKVEITFLPNRVGNTPVVFFNTGANTPSAATPTVIDINGLQLEQSPIASPFTPTDRTGVATVPGDSAASPAPQMVDSDAGWAAFRVRPKWGTGTLDAAAMTITGNEIFDYTREDATYWTTTQKGTQVDSSSFTSGLGCYIDRAATNLFGNGQCDSAANWKWGGGETLTLDASTKPPFSTQSVKVVTDGSVASQYVAAQTATGLAAAATTNAASSIYFKGVAGAAYVVTASWNNADSTTTNQSSSFTATGSWQLVTAPTTAVAAGKTGDSFRITIAISGTRAETFWVAHAMIETGQSVVAPYVATSGGVPATNPIGRVQGLATPGAVSMSATQGWIAIKVRWGFSNTTIPHIAGLFEWGSDGNNRIGAYMNASGSVTAYRQSGGTGGSLSSGALTFNPGDLMTIIVAWTATTLSLSINGSVFSSQAGGNTSIPNLAAVAKYDVGTLSFSPANYTIDSTVAWFAWGSGTLTNADASTISGKTSNGASLLPSNFPGNPQFLWQAKAAGGLRPGGPTLFPTLFDIGPTNNDEMLMFYDTTNGNWSIGRDQNGNTASRPTISHVFNAGDEFVVVATWDSGSMKIGANGVLGAQVTNLQVPNMGGENPPFTLGRRSWNVDGWFYGDVVWAAFGLNRLADSDMLALMARDATTPDYSSLPGSPTMVWGADSAAYTVGESGSVSVDTYSDGPESTLGTFTPLDADLSIYATVFPEYTPRPSVELFDLARLPFQVAQAQLAEQGRDGAPILTTMGWHGTSIDPRTLDASFAVVQEGGPLESYVGRRLRLTPRTGSSRAPLYVYVVASSPDILDPITVTRRAFWQFAKPTDDDVPVLVEVLP